MYQVGDYVLYNYNVCQIAKTTDINGSQYFVMIPTTDPSLTIKIPVLNCEQVLRHIMSKKEAEALIKRIPDIKMISAPDRALEFEYRKLMVTGNSEDLVKIIKTTYLRNKIRKDNGKKVGEKDSKYFKLAEASLYSEISLSLGIDFDKTREYIIQSI